VTYQLFVSGPSASVDTLLQLLGTDDGACDFKALDPSADDPLDLQCLDLHQSSETISGFLLSFTMSAAPMGVCDAIVARFDDLQAWVGPEDPCNEGPTP